MSLRHRLLFLFISALALGGVVYWLAQEPLSYSFIPPSLSSAPSRCGRLKLIHFPLSSTSRNLEEHVPSFEALPLVQYALKSFVESAEPVKFRYAFSIAVDSDDAWYKLASVQDSIRNWFQARYTQQWPGACPVELTFHLYANTRSRNTWAVNYATAYGYEMGADYFYRINDDTVLLKNSWSSVFVYELSRMRPIPGLGVTGPYDPFLEGHLPTHSFVSRKHYEWFGTYFPFLFGNHFSDDWIKYVYGPPYPAHFGEDVRMMVIVANVSIRHMTLQPRYEIKSNRKQLEKQLEVDREELHFSISKKLIEAEAITTMKKPRINRS